MSQYTVQDLLTLMDRLRDPETGCPWDLKQDFASLVEHTLEEAYEVADTIERKDWQHLEDELGDLLFQVVFYSRLGSEEGSFDFPSVVDRLVKKLIRRHPHVFPEGGLSSRVGQSINSEEVSERWEEIKQQERRGRALERVLDEVPKSLPSLSRASKLQKRAATVGFDWPYALQVLDKISEEIEELREAIENKDQAAMQDELGDMLFAQVNLARHLKINPETALRGTNQKFERRFAYIEDQVKASGYQWESFTLEELDHFWSEAKRHGL